MNAYQYQRLQPQDVELLLQLRCVFSRAFDDSEAWESSLPSRAYLKEVLQQDTYIAIVAYTDTGEVVGGLSAYVLPKINKEHSEVYLYDIAVAETHRRQGIATRLITELREIAKSYGASVIFVQADNEDTEALALYTKLCERRETDITHFDISVP